MLVLLERPARHPMRPRFVSRDNPGPAQQNLKRFLLEANVPRKMTVLWNLIPWLPPDDHPVSSVRRADIAAGLAALPVLLGLLPALRVVVLAGRTASGAIPTVHQWRPEIPILTMPHPSPLSVNQHPEVARRIVSALRQARRLTRQSAAVAFNEAMHGETNRSPR
ncbi:uracil-DNA glycosylase family protein [Gluconobacter oxydans]|uniref:uracil-DNA glycosylase family protein n=3 Tax=Pseudomonadota TaxID=1224 RepID=UPI003412B2C4